MSGADQVPPGVPTEPVEDGLDIFQMAGGSISGWLPFSKTGTGTGSRLALPYSTQAEHDAALWAAYHPGVAYLQRADIKPSFASAHRLGCRFDLPFVIPYEFEGRWHPYYIDYVGAATGGGLCGIEASVEELKDDPQSLAKMAAAEEFFRGHGGWYGVFLRGLTVPDLLIHNLERLNAHAGDFAGYDEIANRITPMLLEPAPISIRQVVERLGPEYGDERVEASAWHRVHLAAAAGRLVLDLEKVLLDLDAPISILPPVMDPILPRPLPPGLPPRATALDPAAPPPLLPGPPVDIDLLPERHRDQFRKSLQMALAVLRDGRRAADVAVDFGETKRQVERLVARAKTGGEEALVPYRREVRQTTEIDPVFHEPIRRLARRKQRLTYRQIAESPEIVKAAKRAKRESGVAPRLPTERQVGSFVKRFRERDPEARRVHLAVRRLPHSATSIAGYVRSIPSPALVVQVDEHYLDVFVVTDEGAQLTERVHAAVLVCAKTGAILGAVLSPRALTEEDYTRLLKQAMEPKDAIAARAGAVGRWPCFGRPVTILSDRGRIFISRHATEVVVDRLGITEAIAPPYAPSVKGVVEALFRWVTERFSHRLPGTTKSSPQDRGQYDSQAAALKEGVTFAEIESLFIRAIVDGYMADWDRLRGDVRLDIWDRDVERFGVPQFIGTADELKLLLLRSANKKHQYGLYHVQGGGVSFKSKWYVGEEGLTKRIRGDYVRVYYDRRDIGTIYLFDPKTGAYLGAAHCAEYLSRRVSVWEQEAERRADKDPRAAARAGSSGALTRIVGDAQEAVRARKKAAKAASRAAFLDAQQAEIHPDAVLAERRRLAVEAESGPAWRTDPSSLPGPDDSPRTGRVIPFVRRREAPE